MSEPPMSEADCDRMERAAIAIEAMTEECNRVAAELAQFKDEALEWEKAHILSESRARALEADRDQISLTLDVAKADRDKWFNRARTLEAALRKLGYATVEYVGKRGEGNAFADLVQAEHDARALLPSQVPGVNKDGSYTPPETGAEPK